MIPGSKSQQSIIVTKQLELQPHSALVCYWMRLTCMQCYTIQNIFLQSWHCIKHNCTKKNKKIFKKNKILETYFDELECEWEECAWDEWECPSSNVDQWGIRPPYTSKMRFKKSSSRTSATDSDRTGRHLVGGVEWGMSICEEWGVRVRGRGWLNKG